MPPLFIRRAKTLFGLIGGRHRDAGKCSLPAGLKFVTSVLPITTTRSHGVARRLRDILLTRFKSFALVFLVASDM